MRRSRKRPSDQVSERCLAGFRNLPLFVGAAVLIATSPALAPFTRVPFAWAEPARGQSSSTAPNISAVTLVLPPEVIAGRPFTLAALGPDGRLAPGVTVRLEPDQQVTTDQTGRALFTAPASGNVLFARASGISVAVLLDPPLALATSLALRVAPVLSLRDRFSLCGAAFDGRADANRVRINGQPALVLAASSKCLVVLPGPKATPGSANVSIETGTAQWAATTELVSLEFDSPNPPLLPDKQSQVRLRVRGSEQKLHIVVENESPGVLRFLRGDTQQVVTSGGPENFAALKVKAIRTGDFSFRARLLTSPDAGAARRYLDAAAPLASPDLQSKLQRLAKRLSGSARDSEGVRRTVCSLAAATTPDDLRTLLDAACATL